MKKFTNKILFIGVLAVVFSGIISCEKDFTDIGSSIINNSQFDTKDTILEVEITTEPITSVRAEGINFGGFLGQYLLGIYNNDSYEKLEASIVSQLRLPTTLDATTGSSDSTTVHTELDTIILRLPYQATLVSSNPATYTLDSIIGNQDESFTINVFETGTFLNTLDPNNPARNNSYQSDEDYTKQGSSLTFAPDFEFKPNPQDTAFIINRKLRSGIKFNDTIVLNENKAPFIRIPLNKTKFLEFMSLYESNEFASQDAFNNYFRGIIIEATGDDGSLLSLGFSGQGVVPPSIEMYYTNTVTLNSTNAVLDTVLKNDSFSLGGVTNSIYKMGATPSVSSNQFPIQGTAGNMANIEIFNDGLTGLRAKNWLINDASLTFFVDQNEVDFDTIASPTQLYLYKNPINGTPAIIKDVLTETLSVFDGTRQLSSDNKPDKYTFKITDYVSDLLSGASSNNPRLGLKAFNPTDIPVSAIDTIVDNFNWNPKAVMLLNGQATNGTRKAQLKISYTEKKN